MEATTSSAQQGSNKQRDFHKQPFEKFAKMTLPQLEAELQKRHKELMALSNTLKTVIETVGRILLAAEPHFPTKALFQSWACMQTGRAWDTCNHYMRYALDPERYEFLRRKHNSKIAADRKKGREFRDSSSKREGRIGWFLHGFTFIQADELIEAFERGQDSMAANGFRATVTITEEF